MPFQPTRAEPLSARCNVRLTVPELDELREAANLAGLSLSEYVRRRALGRSVISHADLAVVRELRRVGGLLKHVHMESGGAYSADTAAALREVVAAIRTIGEDRS